MTEPEFHPAMKLYFKVILGIDIDQVVARMREFEKAGHHITGIELPMPQPNLVGVPIIFRQKGSPSDFDIVFYTKQNKSEVGWNGPESPPTG